MKLKIISDKFHSSAKFDAYITMLFTNIYKTKNITDVNLSKNGDFSLKTKIIF
jgi:hypothetical protein